MASTPFSITQFEAPTHSGYVYADFEGSDFGSASSSLTHGTYSLLLPAGTYRLAAQDGNYWSGFPVGVAAGVLVTADTTIDIQLDGIPVSGNVVGPDGLPMEGVGVEAGHASRIATEIDGSYRLYVPPGTYRISFRPPYPFYIFPRIAEPLAISSPASIDCDLRGAEWTGTVRRFGTGDPASGIYLALTQVGDEFDRVAAIKSDSQGESRFILEPNHSYDLRTYDPVANVESVPLQGVAATADTTFEVLVP